MIKCSKCKGMLVKDTEHNDGGKIEVIKCVMCGHREAERMIGLKGREAAVKQVNMIDSQADAAGLPADAAEEKPVSATESNCTVVVCANCGKEKTIAARGLCWKCYDAHKKAGTLDEKYPSTMKPKRAATKPAGNKPVVNKPAAKKPENKKPVRKCKDCGREMPIVGRGMCGKCYDARRKAGTLDEFPATDRYGNVRPEQSKQKTEKNGSTIAPEPSTPMSDPVPVEAWAHKWMPPRGMVILHFNIEDPRDTSLLEKLERAARTDRRTLPAEIITLLEKVVVDG